MVFNAPVFLFIFLPLFFIFYFSFSKIQQRNTVLLVFSLIFYLFGEGRLIFVMIGSIIINYFAGILVANASTHKKKKLWVTTGILVNIIILCVFKYLGFFGSVLNDLGINVPIIEIVLPVGISFFTFQSMSYVVDVYREPKNVQRNVFHLGLYISMFPQLIAGPIVRYSEIQEQINKRNITQERLVSGANRFIIGLLKKCFFANEFAVIADTLMDTSTNSLTTGAAWLGMFAYTFQIYFDFSGYSDMAIGLGRMIGFDFSENFNFPYISRSIQEFWRRWHISLSTWFRDYVYIPLGGSRVKVSRIYINLTIVFFVTGFWHGASWSFILWGLYHGFFMIIERLFLGKVLIRIPSFLSMIYVILVVMIGWVFFRVPEIERAYEYVMCLFSLKEPTEVAYSAAYFYDSKTISLIILAALFSSSLLKPVYDKWEGMQHQLAKISFLSFHLLLLLFCILTVSGDSYNPFIYFRF